MSDHAIEQFNSGVHNLLPAEAIPNDAAQDSLNWVTDNGHIELARGRQLVGAEGSAGDCRGVWFGYKTDGSRVFWRKADTKIQYFDGTNWVDVVTGLGATDFYTFQNYSSLAGSFTFASGPGGIYKFVNANPGSYIDLYDSSKNFKGYILIDKARTLMWGLTTDPTGLYGSYIDAQNSTVYTTVSSEALGTGTGVQVTFSGTLAFKAGGATRNCFGLTITAGAVIGKDNYLGQITGTGIVSGSINYVTGAWTITYAVAPANALAITGTYQWENSNAKGITDFTKSATRLAGEGFVLRQDEGGDAIMRVLLGIDGAYYSIKKFSVYRYTPDDTDTKPTNEVFRKDIGIPTKDAAVATGRGIVFLNTASPEKPRLTVLEKNPLGDNIQATELMPHFAFENYTIDDVVMETYGQFIAMGLKTADSNVNNRLLLLDIARNTADIHYYGVKCMTKDQGVLYCGSPLTSSTFKLFYGFDDENLTIENYWTGKNERMNTERLKKTRKLRLQGHIAPGQKLEVYVNYDNSDFALVGTIDGSGSEVDSSNPGAVGSTLVGEGIVGGYGDSNVVYPYFKEIKLKCPKYRQRCIQYKATSFGYVSVSYHMDWDNMFFEQRIPKKYRQKQNVSLDGTQTDLTPPQF